LSQLEQYATGNNEFVGQYHQSILWNPEQLVCAPSECSPAALYDDG